MFENLGKILRGRFGKKDYLAKQVRIVQILDLYKDGTKHLLGEAAKPISLKNKVLTVRADSAAHANELRLQEHQIVKIINEYFGEEVVARVIYRF